MRSDNQVPGKSTGCCPKHLGAERDVQPYYRLMPQAFLLPFWEDRG
jgi:hypothetical protein